MKTNKNDIRPTRVLALNVLLCATLTLPLLGGCFFGAAAALTTGGIAASDRRTMGTQVEDSTIQLKAGSAIRSKIGDDAHVNVSVYNRQVLLTGEVPDEATRAAAEQAAANVLNVRLITNDLQIAPNSTFGRQSNDTLITGKVKASLLDAQDIFVNAFKVVTESGVVYLLGTVTEREANRAAQIAAGVPGVVKVVKVMEIISEDELTGMTKSPNNGVNRPLPSTSR